MFFNVPGDFWGGGASPKVSWNVFKV